MNLPVPLRGRRRLWFWQLTMLGMIELGALLSLGLGVRHAFDAVLESGASAVQSSGLQWVLLGFFLVALSAAARGWQRPLGERFAQHYARSLRSRVMRHGFALGAHSGPRAQGTFTLRMLGDAGALARWHGRIKARTIANVAALVFVFGFLAWFAWPLALAALLPALIGLAGLFWAGRRLERHAAVARRARSRLIGRALRARQSAAGSRSATRTALEELDSRGRRLARAMVVAARDSGWMDAFGLFTTGGALMAALAVGTWLVAAGDISTGTVLLATVWIGQLSRPVHELARAQDTWRRARVSEQKLEVFFATAPEGK